MNEDKFLCPKCGKTIVEKNLKNISKNDDIIIKSRLVFLNKDSKVLCRCLSCKTLVTLPLQYVYSNLSISKKTSILDL